MLAYVGQEDTGTTHGGGGTSFEEEVGVLRGQEAGYVSIALSEPTNSAAWYAAASAADQIAAIGVTRPDLDPPLAVASPRGWGEPARAAERAGSYRLSGFFAGGGIINPGNGGGGPGGGVTPIPRPGGPGGGGEQEPPPPQPGPEESAIGTWAAWGAAGALALAIYLLTRR